MRSYPFLLILLVFWAGCSLKEESVSFDPSLSLIFSTDTVSFDTLVSARRSPTRRLTVYNPNREAIQLEEIRLGLGSASDYSVIINGRETNILQNERLMGGDSILILTEVEVSPRNRDEIYNVKDSLIFKWNTNTENIKLISYAQDAKKVGAGLVRLCDETWTADRPYIVSDTVLVDAGCQLTIQKGTNVLFENDAIMFIQGSLQAIGDSAEQIVFRNARFDGVFDQTPGQWNGIYFLEGSKSNEIRYASIFNGQVGLRVGTPDDDDIPDVVVSNTSIFNMSRAGILAFTSDVSATNTLIYNCGNYLFGGFAGGNYSLVHCTLSNQPALFIQDEPTVQFSDNLVLRNDELLVNDLSVELINCIVWGDGEEELWINNGGNATLQALLTSNIIKSQEEIPSNFTSQEFNFPGFANPNIIAFDYRLDTLAFAKDKGTPTGVDLDIIGASRDATPDIGAFERKEEVTNSNQSVKTKTRNK